MIKLFVYLIFILATLWVCCSCSPKYTKPKHSYMYNEKQLPPQEEIKEAPKLVRAIQVLMHQSEMTQELTFGILGMLSNIHQPTGDMKKAIESLAADRKKIAGEKGSTVVDQLEVEIDKLRLTNNQLQIALDHLRNIV